MSFSPLPPGVSRPNVLLLLADDLGVGEVGSFATGNGAPLQTPRLDELGRSGIRFTNAYAGGSTCGPSRASLMTGMHAGHMWRTGSRAAIKNLTASDLLLPSLMSEAGYATAAIGKLAPFQDPAEQGFDFFLGQTTHERCHSYYPRFMQMQNRENGRRWINLTRNWQLPVGDLPAARRMAMSRPNHFSYSNRLFHEAAVG